jgi:hypothetical protein
MSETLSIQARQAMSELSEETGKLLALRYVDGWITSHLAKDNITPAYVAALQDIQINVQAAIERISSGHPMESLSEFVNAQ